MLFTFQLVNSQPRLYLYELAETRHASRVGYTHSPFSVLVFVCTLFYVHVRVSVHTLAVDRRLVCAHHPLGQWILHSGSMNLVLKCGNKEPCYINIPKTYK